MLYAEAFTQRNREVAASELKARQHDWVDWDMLLLGLFSGMSIVLFAFIALILTGTSFRLILPL